MLFGDEPRFYKDLRPTCEGGGIFAHVEETETGPHVGPGAYYATELENSRAGWAHKTFTQREPFKPEKCRVDRSHHFTAGVLLSGELIASPCSPAKTIISPGPGYYNVDRGMLSTANNKRPQSAGARPPSAFGHSTTDNKAFPSSSSRGGTNLNAGRNLFKGNIYNSVDQNSQIGPGYYNVKDTLLKKSFNSRVGTGGGGSAKTSPQKSSHWPPVPVTSSGRTSPTGTYVSISPLAQHGREGNGGGWQDNTARSGISKHETVKSGVDSRGGRKGPGSVLVRPATAPSSPMVHRTVKDNYVYQTPR